jgi:cell division protein FtsB
MMEPLNRSRKRPVTYQKGRTFLYFILFAILVIAGFTGYRMLESRHKKDLTTLEKENLEWSGKNDKLRQRINSLEKTISRLSGDIELPTEEEINESVEPSTDLSDGGAEAAVSIAEVERRIAAFFVHLDKEEYIKEYRLGRGTYEVYEETILKISEKPPLLVNETESLNSMFMNIAHFYRLLGVEHLSLIRDVLSYEGEDMESTMRDFFMWYTHSNNSGLKGRPSQQALYEYAGFFLNTIGGRTYLMRRDSKIRILTSYYSLLILDMANDTKQNPYGIDIRPYIRLVYGDISGKSGFMFYSEYVKRLTRLKDKYNIY